MYCAHLFIHPSINLPITLHPGLKSVVVSPRAPQWDPHLGLEGPDWHFFCLTFSEIVAANYYVILLFRIYVESHHLE